MKLLSKFGVFFDHILSICAWLACGCIIFSMMSINADVILRQFFKLPLIWVLEVNEYLLLYVTFLGTAGLDVITRLMGLILAVIGVQMLIGGITGAIEMAK